MDQGIISLTPYPKISHPPTFLPHTLLHLIVGWSWLYPLRPGISRRLLKNVPIDIMILMALSETMWPVVSRLNHNKMSTHTVGQKMWPRNYMYMYFVNKCHIVYIPDYLPFKPRFGHMDLYRRKKQAGTVINNTYWWYTDRKCDHLELHVHKQFPCILAIPKKYCFKSFKLS